MEQNALLCKESGIHRFFLRFMNNFGLWALAAFTFLYSGIQLFDLWENGAENMAFSPPLPAAIVCGGGGGKAVREATFWYNKRVTFFKVACIDRRKRTL